jgi:hypothetical protein
MRKNVLLAVLLVVAVFLLFAVSVYAQQPGARRQGGGPRAGVPQGRPQQMGAAQDRDNNPSGPRGGPGTNWENRPGPQGGPGASPDRKR